MKATELMIGDLIYYCSVNHYVTKVIDVCTHGEEPYIRCKRDERDRLYKQHPIEDFHVGILRPIPLTSEILEANNFQKDPDYIDLYWRPDCRKFCFVKECDDWYFAIRYKGGHICITKCNYVHKLQHILKDLEIEKDIIIIKLL